jgi:hypothetical protein
VSDCYLTPSVQYLYEMMKMSVLLRHFQVYDLFTFIKMNAQNLVKLAFTVTLNYSVICCKCYIQVFIVLIISTLFLYISRCLQMLLPVTNMDYLFHNSVQFMHPLYLSLQLEDTTCLEILIAAGLNVKALIPFTEEPFEMIYLHS